MATSKLLLLRSVLIRIAIEDFIARQGVVYDYLCVSDAPVFHRCKYRGGEIIFLMSLITFHYLKQSTGWPQDHYPNYFLFKLETYRDRQ